MLGRDAKLILIEKSVRTIPYGFLGVLYPVYLSQLGFDAVAIGIVLTLTTLSSALYTLVASIFADRVGRKSSLLFFVVMDTLAALVLLASSAWWSPVLAGIIGNMTVGSGEVGPYLSLEQTILPQSSDPGHRTLVFSVYNLIGYGSTAAGALLVTLPLYFGLGSTDFRPLFLIYLLSGFLGAVLYSRLTIRAEHRQNPTVEKSVSSLLRVSPGSRQIIFRLSALFALDAFGGGFVGQSIISYYFYERYGLQLASLGLILAATSVITAVSFLVSAAISARIGLINTMVFTHIPSNVLLAAVPIAPSLPFAVSLLFARQSVSQMDVPARQSYVVSVVPQRDRMPASGLTSVSRSVSSSISPSLTGLAMTNLWVGSPFIIAGTLKILYDLSLYKAFHGVKLRSRDEDRSATEFKTNASVQREPGEG